MEMAPAQLTGAESGVPVEGGGGEPHSPIVHSGQSEGRVVNGEHDKRLRQGAVVDTCTYPAFASGFCSEQLVFLVLEAIEVDIFTYGDLSGNERPQLTSASQREVPRLL